jgi:DNA-binding IclR family transcriptional regulator
VTTGPEWTHPADERILQYLQENPPDYVALVANRLGMHLGYVERRVETLVEHGLVEPVSGEVVYVVTDEGERYLAEEATPVPADGDDD